MDGCTPDGGWRVELVDHARLHLGDIEERLAAVARRATHIIDDTDWRSDAVAAYRRWAGVWEHEVHGVARQVAEVRDDLVRTRRDILARSMWECG